MSFRSCFPLREPDPSGPGKAFFLVGATATGKTEAAHLIAREYGCGIVSADSMLVYRGMDIGTAKPGEEKLSEVVYHGVNIVDPTETYSVWDYLNHARACVAATRKPVLVVGGTGLYIKALINGLDADAPPDGAERERLQGILDEGGIEALRAEIRAAHPAVPADYVAGERNPRRLIRACERATGLSEQGAAAKVGGAVAGLALDPAHLNERIEKRVREMYSDGLVAEMEGLLRRYGTLSNTAMQAIGYAEAAEVAAGRMEAKTAIEITAARTRQLAKRQRTWFRHQVDVDWIECGRDDSTVLIAERVLENWVRNGATEIA